MKIKQVDYFPQFAPGTYGVDIETTVLFGKHADPFRDRILSIQVSDGETVWICLNPEGFASLVPMLNDMSTTKLIQNSNFDLQFLMHQLGAKPPKQSIWDTLIMERLLHAGEDMRHGLDDIAARRLGVMLDKTVREGFKKHDGEFSEQQIKYACEDAYWLPKIFWGQKKDINDMQLGRVAALENRLTVIVAKATLRGVGFDTALWETYIPQIKSMLSRTEAELGERLGAHQQNVLFGDPQMTMNINSTDQVMKLFKKEGIPLDGSDKKVVQAYLEKHPNTPHRLVLEKILTFRKWARRLSVSYADAVHPKTRRIHASWNQVEAVTGRFSCSEPNLQNLERPTEGAPNMRLLMLPAEGHTFVIADYNQQEPRTLAQISGDLALREACQQEDVYAAMVAQLGNRRSRQDVKSGVLAVFYGVGEETLAATLKVSVADAAAFRSEVLQRFSQAGRWSARTVDMVRSSGIVRTLLGRVRKFPDIRESFSGHMANEAVNTPIQGSSADMFKVALDKADDRTQHLKSTGPCLFIHDEIVLESSVGESEEAYRLLVEGMEEAGRELCPDVVMPAKGHISTRWTKD